MKPLGRPTKYTEERGAQIVSAIRDGATRDQAAALGGISVTTLYRWLSGEQVEQGESEAIFRDFREQVEAAEAARELEMLALIQQAARGHKTTRTRVTGKGDSQQVSQETVIAPDAQAAQWLLRCWNPQRWGKGNGEDAPADSGGVTIRVLPDARPGGQP